MQMRMRRRQRPRAGSARTHMATASMAATMRSALRVCRREHSRSPGPRERGCGRPGEWRIMMTGRRKALFQSSWCAVVLAVQARLSPRASLGTRARTNGWHDARGSTWAITPRRKLRRAHTTIISGRRCFRSRGVQRKLLLAIQRRQLDQEQQQMGGNLQRDAPGISCDGGCEPGQRRPRDGECYNTRHGR